MKHKHYPFDTGTELDFEQRRFEKKRKQGSVLVWMLIVLLIACFGMLGMIIFQLVSK